MEKRALISVSDKTGLDVIGKGLSELGYTLVSTGGTATALRDFGIPVMDVSEVTEFPECFGGRVKSMHPLVLGPILFRRENEEDVVVSRCLKMVPIDIVVVNFYDFSGTINADTTFDEVIEKIDIGGPSLVRATAKNFRDVTVLVHPVQYQAFLSKMREGKWNLYDRFKCAQRAFAFTAQYDIEISQWLNMQRVD